MCINVMGLSLKFTCQNAQDAFGTRGRGVSPGLLGAGTPAATGSSCCPRAADAGTQPCC